MSGATVSNTRGVAIIGASESTLWTFWLLKNIRAYGYAGEIWPVNPRRDEVYGVPTYASVDDLPAVPEYAIVMTGNQHVAGAVAALGVLGVREVAVVSDGFRETATPEGIERERVLTEVARQYDIRLVGPNCVGFASFHEDFVGIAEPIPQGIHAGEVSLISQSGSLTHTALAVLKEEGLGIDVVYSIGNGPIVGFERACELITARPTTRVVCAVVESIKDRDALARAVRDGRKNGVEYVFLVLGKSADGRRAAKSHTGAVTGDQRIMRSWMTHLGVVVVDSPQELARAASLLLAFGRPAVDRGVFILTPSGGATGLAADMCEAVGLPLATISEATRDLIAPLVLPGTVIGNPLDTTFHGTPEQRRQLLTHIANDPAVGLLIEPSGIQWPDDSDDFRFHRAHFDEFIDVAVEAGKVMVFASIFDQEPTPYIARHASAGRLLPFKDLDVTLRALAHLYDHTVLSAVTESARPTSEVTDDSIIDEAPARDILQGLGFPIVEGRFCPTHEAAREATSSLAAPWVVKLALSGLGHKGRVGGVRLGLSTADAVAQACTEIVDAVVAEKIAPASDVAFLVQEMCFGPELLVGLVRDEASGPSIVVGIGGWAAESGSIFLATPIGEGQIDILAELGRSQLPGLVGQRRVEALVPLLEELAAAFTSGGLQTYLEVECNPIILTDAGPKIADALLVRGA
jgi:acyl-CoA synthetase (NDP forming)